MDCEIEKNKVSKKASYGKAFKAAFPYTIPVMTGYLFIGMAFGVMIQEKGYNFLWAILMSVLCYAGSGQYLAVNFFAPGVSLLKKIVPATAAMITSERATLTGMMLYLLFLFCFFIQKLSARKQDQHNTDHGRQNKIVCAGYHQSCRFKQ